MNNVLNNSNYFNSPIIAYYPGFLVVSQIHNMSSRTCFGIFWKNKDSEINLPAGQAGSE